MAIVCSSRVLDYLYSTFFIHHPCLSSSTGRTFWVILAIIWGLIATFCCIVLPIFEARSTWWLCIKTYVSEATSPPFSLLAYSLFFTLT